MENFIIIFYLILLIPLGLVGSHRQLGITRSLIFGLVLTPIIGLILVLFSPQKLRIRHYKIRKKCADCNNDLAKGFCEKCSNANNWSLINHPNYNPI